ncbi:uncharacterized protein B0I36DRAFT_338322 [Microdochium trichocladiopsis]|uniref:Uncharacterized protein n=1 Tax=Microdochium trichocladiopsis TaxID=1682393 RepID=A0A9P8XRY4_9PEZI|nr:uncharacterized protein B0I36DRAFT_338322 [Microdochium trichocladiopsis]KAH7014156.1 hypothetical protein B0I36DRAFT_338322 [Microdochium trichocladiopsis]
MLTALHLPASLPRPAWARQYPDIAKSALRQHICHPCTMQLLPESRTTGVTHRSKLAQHRITNHVQQAMITSGQMWPTTKESPMGRHTRLSLGLRHILTFCACLPPRSASSTTG